MIGYTITQESFDTLIYYQNSSHNINWNSPFVLPAWLQVWWQAFVSGSKPYLGTIRHGDQILGLAPLSVNGNTASLIGSDDVCDYLDFVVSAGKERGFFTVLLADLKTQGINHLDLKPLRPESTVLTSLVPLAQEQGYEIITNPLDVSLEIDLPATWEEYLEILGRKQRHEVRRKLRRLGEEGSIKYHVVSNQKAIHNTLDIFFDLFSRSRKDKAAFMTPHMTSFFRSMVDTMSEIGLVRFGILELNSQPVAIVMYFDYNNCIYLYNSGYDPQYKFLNVGLLSKALCIQDNILKSKRKFDFLKGGEIYKYHLGGKEILLYSCQITIT